MEQKRGEGTQRFKEEGKAGSRGGCLKKGGLESPYKLCLHLHKKKNKKQKQKNKKIFQSYESASGLRE